MSSMRLILASMAALAGLMGVHADPFAEDAIVEPISNTGRDLTAYGLCRTDFIKQGLNFADANVCCSYGWNCKRRRPSKPELCCPDLHLRNSRLRPEGEGVGEAEGLRGSGGRGGGGRGNGRGNGVRGGNGGGVANGRGNGIRGGNGGGNGGRVRNGRGNGGNLNGPQAAHGLCRGGLISKGVTSAQANACCSFGYNCKNRMPHTPEKCCPGLQLRNSRLGGRGRDRRYGWGWGHKRWL